MMVKIFLTVPFSSRVGDDGNVESSDRVAVLLDERFLQVYNLNAAMYMQKLFQLMSK